MSSTAVDILPITKSIMTDHSLFSLRQEADVPVDNVRIHVILDYPVPVETDLLKVSENLISEIKFVS